MTGTLRLLSIAAVAGGCGASTVALRETTPLTISARAPAPPEHVQVEATRIRVDDRIHFETASAVISTESHGALDQVARAINEHSEIDLLRIEGHTDRRGSASYNRRLSQSRAEAVLDYLVGRGVDRERLEARGYGFDRPVASNEDEAGRSQNRRVEFNIVASDGAQARTAPGLRTTESL